LDIVQQALETAPPRTRLLRRARVPSRGDDCPAPAL